MVNGVRTVLPALAAALFAGRAASGRMVELWSRIGSRGLPGDARRTLHVRRLARQG